MAKMILSSLFFIHLIHVCVAQQSYGEDDYSGIMIPFDVRKTDQHQICVALKQRVISTKLMPVIICLVMSRYSSRFLGASR